MAASLYYKPSESSSLISIVVFVILGLPGSYFLAYAIGWSTASLVPGFRFFSILISLLSIALGSAMMGWFIVRYGKIRGEKFARFYGALFAIITYYISWAFWINELVLLNQYLPKELFHQYQALAESQQFMPRYLLLHPKVLWEWMLTVSDYGTWCFFGANTVSGWVLRVAWVIEGIILIPLPAHNFAQHLSTRPYDEINDRWYDYRELPRTPFIENEEYFKECVENGNESVIKELVLNKAPDNLNYSFITLYFSKGDTYYFSLQNVKVRDVFRNGRNERVELKNELIKIIQLSKASGEFLMSHFSDRFTPEILARLARK
jgi:hypothetical protein